VIFGKPNIDGMGAGQNEMSQFSNPINPEGLAATKNEGAEEGKPEGAKVEEPAVEDLSEEGLSPENIKMVMDYGKCSRAEAIKLLRETNNDSVNAIMKLDKSSN
jgi:nascent polypeptide-associated complex subunit alpha